MPVTTRSASRRMAAAQAIFSPPAAIPAIPATTTPCQHRIKSRRVNGRLGILISPPEGVTPTHRVVLTTGASGQTLTRIRGPGERLLLRVPGKAPAASTSKRRLSTFVRGGRVWIRIRPAVGLTGGVMARSQDQGKQPQPFDGINNHQVKLEC